MKNYIGVSCKVLPINSMLTLFLCIYFKLGNFHFEIMIFNVLRKIYMLPCPQDANKEKNIGKPHSRKNQGLN